MKSFLQKYAGRFIAMLVILAVTVYALRGITRLSDALNSPDFNSSQTVQGLDSEHIPRNENMLSNMLSTEGQWVFADSLWAVTPRTMEMADFSNLIHQWPKTIPTFTEDTLPEEQRILDMLHNVSDRFVAFMEIIKTLYQSSSIQQSLETVSRLSWRKDEASPCCRYTMENDAFCAVFFTVEQSSQERLLHLVLGFRSEETTWSVLHLVNHRNSTIKTETSIVPMPDMKSLICSRLDDEGEHLLEIHQTTASLHELSQFWEIEGWNVTMNNQKSQVRCVKTGRIADILVYSTSRNTMCLIVTNAKYD